MQYLIVIVVTTISFAINLQRVSIFYQCTHTHTHLSYYNDMY